jgi:hypothetical protein
MKFSYAALQLALNEMEYSSLALVKPNARNMIKNKTGLLFIPCRQR